jgi:hypothetical protein
MLAAFWTGVTSQKEKAFSIFLSDTSSFFSQWGQFVAKERF